MIERPTPETDDQPTINAINDNGYQVPCVDIEFARKLERELGDALDDLQVLRSVLDRIEQLNGLCNLLRDERDEARSELSLKQQTLTIAEGTLSDLRKQRDEWAAMCGRYKQERDIAEEDATNYFARIIELIAERDKTKRERDELKEALLIMENLLKPGIELFPEIGEILKQGGAK